MTPGDLRFDVISAREADVLVSLARAFHEEDGHRLSTAGERALHAIAEGEPLARCWLIRLAEETIGYVVLTLGYSVEHGGRDGFIDDLYVIDAARGRGIGAAALEFAVAEATELGIRTLHLEAAPENERAIGLYRRRGFMENGRRLMSLRLHTAGR
jgi:ribosomal protein S18 acetylase RimI-like enzyme